jgi:hypothetical protein
MQPQTVSNIPSCPSAVAHVCLYHMPRVFHAPLLPPPLLCRYNSTSPAEQLAKISAALPHLKEVRLEHCAHTRTTCIITRRARVDHLSLLSHVSSLLDTAQLCVLTTLPRVNSRACGCPPRGTPPHYPYNGSAWAALRADDCPDIEQIIIIIQLARVNSKVCVCPPATCTLLQVSLGYFGAEDSPNVDAAALGWPGLPLRALDFDSNSGEFRLAAPSLDALGRLGSCLTQLALSGGVLVETTPSGVCGVLGAGTCCLCCGSAVVLLVTAHVVCLLLGRPLQALSYRRAAALLFECRTDVTA